MQLSYLTIAGKTQHISSSPKVTNYLYYFFLFKQTKLQISYYIKCIVKTKDNSFKNNCYSLPSSYA